MIQAWDGAIPGDVRPVLVHFFLNLPTKSKTKTKTPLFQANYLTYNYQIILSSMFHIITVIPISLSMWDRSE